MENERRDEEKGNRDEPPHRPEQKPRARQENSSVKALGSDPPGTGNENLCRRLAEESTAKRATLRETGT